MEEVKILGIPIYNMKFDEFVLLCQERLEQRKQTVIYTPNPEIVMAASKDKKLREVLLRGDFRTADGIGLIYASKIRRKPLVDRIRGYDLSLKLLEIAAKEGYRVYLLGAQPGRAQKAKEQLEKCYPGIQIVGAQHGYFKGLHCGYEAHDEEKQVLLDIQNKRPDILFVGFGSPKQEMWIDAYRDVLPNSLWIGNGGTIDILSGQVELAPGWVRKIGFEWLYRMIKDPKRAKRQIILPIFMLKILFGKRNVVE